MSGPGNPLASTRADVPADCPMRGENDSDHYGVRFTIGSTTDALDVPVEVVFERESLRRFVTLANKLLGDAGPADPPGEADRPHPSDPAADRGGAP